MSKYDWNFAFSESFLEMQKRLEQIQFPSAALAISEAWEAAVSKYDFSSFSAAWEHSAAVSKSLADLNASIESLSGLMGAISAMQSIEMPSIATSVLPLIDTSALDALKDTMATAAMTVALEKTDWSWLSEVFTEEGDENTEVSETVIEKEVDPEIRDQLAADITEVLSEPESMHITSKDKYLEWAKKSPEHALQFLSALFMLVQTICMMIQLGVSAWEARPVKDSQVYQEPASTSNVVYNLTVENNVTVVGNVPYYYEVEIVNPKTGELVKGYVYKGNITTEEADETEAGEVENTDEDEATEASETIPDATANPTEPID